MSQPADIRVPAVLSDFDPAWGIVLGSGLGEFVDALRIHAVVPFSDVDGLRVPRIAGHAARFVLAEAADQRVLVAQGRVHLYEGYSASEVTATIRLMAAAGVQRILLTNAAGSLSAHNVPGAWMMITDHLNLTGTSPLRGSQFADMSEVYSRRLRTLFGRAAAQIGISLREGVYAGALGPQYETPAEIRMLRTLGADAVGMSTVLEAIQARALGLEVAAFSCLTNWAAGFAGILSHEEVVRIGTQGAGTFARLVEKVFDDYA